MRQLIAQAWGVIAHKGLQPLGGTVDCQKPESHTHTHPHTPDSWAIRWQTHRHDKCVHGDCGLPLAAEPHRGRADRPTLRALSGPLSTWWWRRRRQWAQVRSRGSELISQVRTDPVACSGVQPGSMPAREERREEERRGPDFFCVFL